MPEPISAAKHEQLEARVIATGLTLFELDRINQQEWPIWQVAWAEHRKACEQLLAYREGRSKWGGIPLSSGSVSDSSSTPQESLSGSGGSRVATVEKIAEP